MRIPNEPRQLSRPLCGLPFRVALLIALRGLYPRDISGLFVVGLSSPAIMAMDLVQATRTIALAVDLCDAPAHPFVVATSQGLRIFL